MKYTDGFVKCDSYHTKDVTRFTYDRYTGRCDGSYTKTVGVCWGTRECDECRCDGNKLDCTFYPENREEAKKQLEEYKQANNKKYTPKEKDMRKIDPTNEEMMKDLSTFTTTEKPVNIGGNSGKVFVIDRAKKLSYLMLFESGGVTWYKTGSEDEWRKYRGSIK